MTGTTGSTTHTEVKELWSQLSAPLALQLARELQTNMDEVLGPQDLITDLAETVQRLLLAEAGLAELASSASPPARKRLLMACRRGARSYLQAVHASTDDRHLSYPSRVQADVAAAVAREKADERFVDESELVTAFQQLLSNPEALRHVRKATSARLGGELYLIAREDLLATATKLLSNHPRQTGDAQWLRPGPEIALSVDLTALSCARYLAGLVTINRDEYGFDRLPSKRAGRGKRVAEVTVKAVADREAADRGESAPLQANELKAKTFVAVLTLAAEAQHRGDDPQRFQVRLRDLMALLGYALGSQTSSPYYWRYTAEVTRYLALDLASRVSAMQVTLPGQAEPLIVHQWLLHHPRPLTRELQLHPTLERALFDTIRGEESGALIELVRTSELYGFELGVDEEILKALGIARPMNAVERVPAELLALKGPAFWLAWHNTCVRRGKPVNCLFPVFVIGRHS
ncbi:MAG: hypothetical protein JSV66_06230 [Trueperaceae bacterium]|nr:MAG: hypothetical protein JSV66_06230 [Trueperaceae bacterium]